MQGLPERAQLWELLKTRNSLKEYSVEVLLSREMNVEGVGANRQGEEIPTEGDGQETDRSRNWCIKFDKRWPSRLMQNQ